MMIVFCVLSLFPREVLDEILDILSQFLRVFLPTLTIKMWAGVGRVVPWSWPGRPTIWMIVGQGPIALAVGAGGCCLDIFTISLSLSLSLGDVPI